MIEKIGKNSLTPDLSTMKKYHADIVLLATALALAVIASVATAHVGLFAQQAAHVDLAIKISLWTASALSILLSSLIYSHQEIHSYSRNNKPALQKMCGQLTYAIQEGKLNKKAVQAMDIPSDFKAEISAMLSTGAPGISCMKKVTTLRKEACCISHTQGYRDNDEDAYVYHQDRFLGVFDGHGDECKAANLVAENLPKKLFKLIGKSTDENTVAKAVMRAVTELEAAYKGDGGTTACCALKIENAIYTINVGDSRAILVKTETQYQLSEDADPENLRFKKAVERLGGKIKKDRIEVRSGRDYGLARDIGEKGLPNTPKITKIIHGKGQDDPAMGMIYFSKGDYLVIACDGLWDVATTEEVADAVREMGKKGLPLEKMSEILVRCAYNAYSGDNITAGIWKL